MPYKRTEQKFNGKINVCEIGAGDAAISIGGEKTLPFLGDEGFKTAVGIAISDAPEDWADCFKTIYGDDLKNPAAFAKAAVEKSGADFILVKLASADPNGADNSVENCVATAVAVEAAVKVPVVIEGCKNAEKDAKLLEAVAKALENKNVVLFSAVEDNYKTIGAAGAMAYGQKVSAESAVDINLAKQLNILLTQLGVKSQDIVMDVGSAAAGYGFEYVASTMDRIRLAGLGQNDESLQMPIITDVSSDSWSVKESVFTEAEAPEWGSLEARGIGMEVTTAAACVVGGSNAIIVRHPESAKTIKSMIAGLIG
ncbi:acetyl-CoA decarbonylase/synthase complex subunit delta [Acetobacterium paludosum]|uniref:Acetyl-CoA decarbonylase/synthase complex subunit delta n=1 Tax=Acetobacterium paludosum TaxID=52693 RepID=A0A923HRH1_9FIRM|nr:acetyl-CoA decarbonylase/synthase complex subunit delta [Acetobacterium paludosum]MBC3887041.1 acetyl-CoA decarbonylase/synthase complex subunit delta [Acetobacterium paludosum]